MKKNVMMRVAAILLVCVLATTCGISGTFAKYVTTGSASDTARVAKWGVKVVTEGQSAFATEYNNVASFNSTDLIVAPGTSSKEVTGNLIFGVTGTPEVATRIKVEFTGSDIFWDDYHPIVFTLHIADSNTAGDPDWDNARTITGTLEQIEAEINAQFGGANGFTTQPNEVLDAWYMITWEWAFSQNDTLDTCLGDLAANGGGVFENCSTVLTYGVTITVEQVD